VGNEEVFQDTVFVAWHPSDVLDDIWSGGKDGDETIYG
jgi:hypothetical protein